MNILVKEDITNKNSTFGLNSYITDYFKNLSERKSSDSNLIYDYYNIDKICFTKKDEKNIEDLKAKRIELLNMLINIPSDEDITGSICNCSRGILEIESLIDEFYRKKGLLELNKLKDNKDFKNYKDSLLISDDLSDIDIAKDFIVKFPKVLDKYKNIIYIFNNYTDLL